MKKSKKVEPKLIITTVYTAKGWTTSVALPDGRVVTRTMKREGPGVYRGTRKGGWEDDGLPSEVYNEIERIDGCEGVHYMHDLKYES